MTDPVEAPKPNLLLGKDPLSTKIGLGLAALIEILQLFEATFNTMGLSPRTVLILHFAAGAIAIVMRFVNIFNRAAVVALLALALTGPARAQDATPPLAGLLPGFTICTSSARDVCWGPSVAVIPFTFDLHNGNIGPSLVFDAGFGVTMKRGAMAYGSDLLLGSTVNGGWNAALQFKVGPAGQASFRLGPVMQHGGATPGTRFFLGFGAGL